MRASLWLFGRELLTFEVDWQDDGDDVEPEPARPAPPVEAVSVPGPGAALADTALGEHSDPDTQHSDPDTQHSGFGFPMRPKPGSPPPSRDLLFGFVPEGGD